jgi:hypothetical protein
VAVVAWLTGKAGSPAAGDDGVSWAGSLPAAARAALLVVPVVVTLLAGRAVAPPTVVGEEAPETEFSAGRALAVVREVARAPRPVGSAEHARVRTLLQERLTALGLEVVTQAGTSCSHAVGQTRCARVTNVLARLRGTGGGHAVMLSAHTDSGTVSPGAADNGAGVAALVETARALQAAAPLRNDVILAFPDGEEEGLLGARLFTREHPWRHDVRVVINLEARGTAGPSLMYETSPGNARLVEAFAAAVPHPVSSSVTYTASRLLPNDTDATVYKAAGLPTLGFALAARTHPYHLPNDDVAHLDPRSLQHHGEQALALARHLGDADLGGLVGTGDHIYFDLAGWVLVHYPDGLGQVLVLLSLLGWALVARLACRRGLTTWRGVGAGLWALVLATVLAVAAVALPHAVLARVDAWRVTMAHAPWLHVGYVLAAGVAAGAAYGWKRRRHGVVGLQLGALLGVAVVAAVTGVLVPGSSYLFQWPLALGSLCVLVLVARGIRPGVRALLVVAVVVPALVVVGEGLALAMDMQQGMAPEVVAWPVAWTVAVLVPHVAVALGQAQRVVLGWGGVVATALLAWQGLAIWADEDTERPHILVYATQPAQGQASWLSLDRRVGPPAARYLGPTPGRASLPQYTAWPDAFFHAPAPRVERVAPTLTVESDTLVAGGGRRMVLRARSPGGARCMEVWEAGGGPARLESVDGQAVFRWGRFSPETDRLLWELLVGPVPDSSAWVRFCGVPEEGFLLDLAWAGRGHVLVVAVDHVDGLPDLPGGPEPPPWPWVAREPGQVTLVSHPFLLAGPGDGER